MRVPLLNLRRRAREEALAWLARLKRGLRQNEGPELQDWLRRRSHRRVIAKAAVEWHGPEVLAVLSELFPIDPAILEPRSGPHPAFIAAAAVVGAGITLVIPFVIDTMMGMHGHTYTTALKATRRVALEDGTRVELNRGTLINVYYAEHIRSVLVARGEAIFKVVGDADRPFHVHAADRDFETRSATFDVRLAAPDRLSLTVLQGTVTVLPALPRKRPDGGYERVADPLMYRSILLEPHQMLIMEPQEESGRTLTQEDMRSRLSWQAGS
jgi:transmembrane sensor